MSTKEQDPGHIVTGVILWTIDGHERNAAAPSTFLAVPEPEKGTILARNEPYGLPQRAPEAELSRHERTNEHRDLVRSCEG